MKKLCIVIYGQPPFNDVPHEIDLVVSILEGLRESPVPDTPKDYVKLYTDCWSSEPKERPTINQVADELKAIIAKYDTTIKDIHLDNVNENSQLTADDKQQFISNAVEPIENSHNSSLHGELSQIMQNFVMMSMKEIDSSMALSNQSEDSFNILVNDIINFFYKYEDCKIEKREILTYLNNRYITLQEINNLLLYNHNNSNSLIVLERFGYLGIRTGIDEKEAFELYQKSADLKIVTGMNILKNCYKDGVSTNINQKIFELYQSFVDLGDTFGMISLGNCYKNGFGTEINKQKAFELYQKAANLEDTSGMYNLGYCYERGIGTDIDEKKALKLYKMAADLGNSAAQYNLA
ncbi:kinase-like domain-containing protein [Rhizophagus irregularis DAOM 181602=DAOM 197198]|nr:kinase-like domain-containing protein [Rhizophagus irregularis DAOM 181602=DAOM 197198]